MHGRRLRVVFFDAMGTILSLKPWVIAMGNEFAQLSRNHNVKFEDLYNEWGIEWKRVNQEIRRDKTKPFQSVKELFREAFTIIGKRLGMRLQQGDIQGIIERITSYVNENSVCYPDVRETIKELRKQGYKISVISDADADDLTLQLRSAGILDSFDTVTTSSEAMSYKPNSKIFEIALAKMKCKPFEGCHIGDSQEIDIAGANNIGLHSILVTHGKTEINENLPKPTHVVKQVSEVIPLLKNRDQDMFFA
nr:HAD family hydrolase [Candidatus Njordarchaeota archaeon]